MSGRKVTHFSLQIGTEKDSCSPAQPQYQAESRGEMQKLLRDGSKKHSDPAKASFPVGGSMWALSRLHQTSLALFHHILFAMDPNVSVITLNTK